MRNQKIITEQKAVSGNEECDQNLGVIKAKVAARPTLRGYVTMSRIVESGSDLQTLHDELQVQAQTVLKDNDLGLLESMLLSQAQVLQGVFHYAAERIAGTSTIEQLRAYSDLTIKANAACRKTVVALSHLKNPPPVTFIRQQNNAINQQVNNDKIPEISHNSANELLSLEQKASETLDARRALKTSRVDQAMAAVEVGRRKNARRKSNQ